MDQPYFLWLSNLGDRAFKIDRHYMSILLNAIHNELRKNENCLAGIRLNPNIILITEMDVIHKDNIIKITFHLFEEKKEYLFELIRITKSPLYYPDGEDKFTLLYDFYSAKCEAYHDFMRS